VLLGSRDADGDCIGTITQIAAVQAPIEKVALGLVDGPVRHCMPSAEEDDRSEKAGERMGSVGRC
jgi:DNA-binding FrmR family transcriptional regulator